MGKLGSGIKIQGLKDHKQGADRLTYKEKKAMPTKEFALPEQRKYPINDKAHARNALARVSQFGDSAEKAEVRAKVHAKFPGIGKKK